METSCPERKRHASRTSVEVAPSSRRTVPWLMMSETIQDGGWTDPAGAKHALTQPLHALNESDRLVGLLGVDAKLAQSIFPDAHIVPIPLETGWTPEPAAAWEALDAVVVTENNLPALQACVDALLLAGTTIAVASPSAPAIHQTEWTHAGPLWLLHRQPLMAHDPINPEVYGPTYDWIRGRTPLDRARILLLAIILSIAVVAIALWSRIAAGQSGMFLSSPVCIGGAAGRLRCVRPPTTPENRPEPRPRRCVSRPTRCLDVVFPHHRRRSEARFLEPQQTCLRESSASARSRRHPRLARRSLASRIHVPPRTRSIAGFRRYPPRPAN